MRTRTLKVRIVPDAVQNHKIDATLNCCRFVYNHMLSRNRKVYERRKEHMTYNTMQNLLPKMKTYLPWLAEADSQALKDACRRLDAAFVRFFKKQSRYPRFKRKKSYVQSYTSTNSASIRYEKGRVRIPCIGWVTALDDRMLPDGAKIRRVIVRYDHGQYYAGICYQVEDDVKEHPVKEENVIGLDYKSDGMYISSDGICCGMPHYYRESQHAIAKEQRKLAKKKGARKGERRSSNYKKQLERLFKKARHAADQRRDFLHKQSTEIANRYDAVCVEDLNMRAMSNKCFGNGKATLDNGYGMFLAMLGYKLEDRGKKLLRVDRWYPSSQTCSNCGHRESALKDLRIRRWTCPVCGAKHDRDINAAMNIRKEGIRILRDASSV